eukprot:Rmarinus@m.2675
MDTLASWETFSESLPPTPQDVIVVPPPPKLKESVKQQLYLLELDNPSDVLDSPVASRFSPTKKGKGARNRKKEPSTKNTINSDTRLFSGHVNPTIHSEVQSVDREAVVQPVLFSLNLIRPAHIPSGSGPTLPPRIPRVLRARNNPGVGVSKGNEATAVAGDCLYDVNTNSTTSPEPILAGDPSKEPESINRDGFKITEPACAIEGVATCPQPVVAPGCGLLHVARINTFPSITDPTPEFSESGGNDGVAREPVAVDPDASVSGGFDHASTSESRSPRNVESASLHDSRLQVSALPHSQSEPGRSSCLDCGADGSTSCSCSFVSTCSSCVEEAMTSDAHPDAGRAVAGDISAVSLAPVHDVTHPSATAPMPPSQGLEACDSTAKLLKMGKKMLLQNLQDQSKRCVAHDVGPRWMPTGRGGAGFSDSDPRKHPLRMNRFKEFLNTLARGNAKLHLGRRLPEPPTVRPVVSYASVQQTKPETLPLKIYERSEQRYHGGVGGEEEWNVQGLRAGQRLRQTQPPKSSPAPRALHNQAPHKTSPRKLIKGNSLPASISHSGGADAAVGVASVALPDQTDRKRTTRVSDLVGWIDDDQTFQDAPFLIDFMIPEESPSADCPPPSDTRQASAKQRPSPDIRIARELAAGLEVYDNNYDICGESLCSQSLDVTPADSPAIINRLLPQESEARTNQRDSSVSSSSLIPFRLTQTSVTTAHHSSCPVSRSSFSTVYVCETIGPSSNNTQTFVAAVCRDLPASRLSSAESQNAVHTGTWRQADFTRQSLSFRAVHRADATASSPPSPTSPSLQETTSIADGHNTVSDSNSPRLPDEAASTRSSVCPTPPADIDVRSHTRSSNVDSILGTSSQINCVKLGRSAHSSPPLPTVCSTKDAQSSDADDDDSMHLTHYSTHETEIVLDCRSEVEVCLPSRQSSAHETARSWRTRESGTPTYASGSCQLGNGALGTPEAALMNGTHSEGVPVFDASRTQRFSFTGKSSHLRSRSDVGMARLSGVGAPVSSVTRSAALTEISSLHTTTHSLILTCTCTLLPEPSAQEEDEVHAHHPEQASEERLLSLGCDSLDFLERPDDGVAPAISDAGAKAYEAALDYGTDCSCSCSQYSCCSLCDWSEGADDPQHGPYQERRGLRLYPKEKYLLTKVGKMGDRGILPLRKKRKKAKNPFRAFRPVLLSHRSLEQRVPIVDPEISSTIDAVRREHRRCRPDDTVDLGILKDMRLRAKKNRKKTGALGEKIPHSDVGVVFANPSSVHNTGLYGMYPDSDLFRQYTKAHHRHRSKEKMSYGAVLKLARKMKQKGASMKS